jgi:hypothetical protein
MNVPESFSRIVDGKKYDVRTAKLLASDCYWDGQNWERSGRNCFLYGTPRGNYFTVNLTQWQGERDTLTPVTLEDAVGLYERSLPEHAVEYSEAFPSVTVEDA